MTGNPEACQSGEQLQQRLAVNNSGKEQQVPTQTFVRNTGKVRGKDHPRSERARTVGPQSCSYGENSAASAGTSGCTSSLAVTTESTQAQIDVQYQHSVPGWAPFPVPRRVVTALMFQDGEVSRSLVLKGEDGLRRHCNYWGDFGRLGTQEFLKSQPEKHCVIDVETLPPARIQYVQVSLCPRICL